MGWSRRKILIAVLASIGILAVIGTTVASMIMPLLGHHGRSEPIPAASAPTVVTTPAVVIKPLDVRTVEEVPLVAKPEECPPVPPPTPPQEPVRICDVEKEATYRLGPVALHLTLTDATSVQLPNSDLHTVQMVMDAFSQVAFAQYTAANVGKQVAFVRDGVVLAAPAISEPINGESLQLSGQLSAATADMIAQLLRNGS